LADVGAYDSGRPFSALEEFFVADTTLSETLTRVAELACAVSRADMAGITLLVEGRPRTGVFTDPEAVVIDESQYGSGDGPCLDAFRIGQTFRIDEMSQEQRWPEFGRAASEHGIVTTLSLPIIARDESFGALNLYARQPGVFAQEPSATLDGFVRQAAILLANSQAYWQARELGENLATAMRSRATIERAVGILMAPGGRSAEEAFQVLVRASQRENRKLRDIAADVVEQAQLRGPSPVGE